MITDNTADDCNKVWKDIPTEKVIDNDRFSIQINQLKFTILKKGEEYFGIESVCPHSGGPLGSGDIEDLSIKCPWHGFKYSLSDGSCEDDPDHSAITISVKKIDSKFLIYVHPKDIIQFIKQEETCLKTVDSIQIKPIQENKTLIDWAFSIINTSNASLKVELTFHVAKLWNAGELKEIGKSINYNSIPPRDPQLEFTRPNKASKRGNGGTVESRIAILHALANIEQWAIDLGWDIIVRFAQDLPHEFSSDFIKLASDEAKHFTFLETRLKDLGSFFGAIKVHGSLWEAALETKDDILARLAIVHMVHEGRGLDVNPKTIEKFRKASDFESVEKLEIIHSDEITHVALGQKWFSSLCKEKQLDQYDTFHSLVRKFYRGLLKPPFNKEDRLKAGLDPNYYLPLSVTAALN